MYHLRVPVFLLTALVLLRCIAAAPSNRYFSPGSSSADEQENALVDKESRSLRELISNPNPGLGFTQMTSHRLQMKKEKLKEKQSHLSKGGKKSIGKKNTHQPPAQLPF